MFMKFPSVAVPDVVILTAPIAAIDKKFTGNTGSCHFRQHDDISISEWNMKHKTESCRNTEDAI